MDVLRRRGLLLYASLVIFFGLGISAIAMVKGKSSTVASNFPVAVSEWDWNLLEGGYLYAEGAVWNKGGRPVKYVVVTVRFLKQPVGTSAKELVCRADALLEEWDELSPGEASPFHVKAYNRRASEVSHAEISLRAYDPSKPEGELALLSVQLRQIKRAIREP
jgi:hypothetical protein